MYQDIEYNNIRGSTLKIFARERPPIPAARKRREEIIIPGRDGSLYTTNGDYEPTEITVQFNYIGPPEEWAARWRAAKKWLSAENSILKFSDDGGIFYKISHVELGENERPTEKIGIFEATFITRDGLSYLVEGQKEYEARDVLTNFYEAAHPIYRIIGEGRCALTVNGNTMTANVGQNLTIDTDRMMAYRENGELQNTEVTGDFEKLYLREGENDISISSGFGLKVIPNWRCL